MPVLVRQPDLCLRHAAGPTSRGFCAGAVHGTAWELEEVRGNAVKTMLTLAAISTVASLQVFGKDRLIFWRESASGGVHALEGCHLPS